MIRGGMGKMKKTKGSNKRLSGEQVRALERAFKESNRLGMERKARLAKDLSLQPRQIAVWFQNRRARSKTKQMESAFDGLNHQLTQLTAQRDDLLLRNDHLHAQIATLKKQLSLKESTSDSAMSSSGIPPERDHLEYSPTISIIDDNDITWNLPNTWSASSHFTNVPILCTTSSNFACVDHPIMLDDDFLFCHHNNSIYVS